jgi:hypothetical protein
MKLMRWLIVLFIVSAISFNWVSSHDKHKKTAATHDTSGKFSGTAKAGHISTTTSSTIVAGELADNTVNAINNPDRHLDVNLATQFYAAADDVIHAYATGEGRENYPQIWPTYTDPFNSGVVGPFLTDASVTSENLLDIDASQTNVNILVYYDGTTYGNLSEKYSNSVMFSKANGKWQAVAVS